MKNRYRMISINYIFLLLISGFSIVFWDLHPNIATYSNVSWKTVLYLLIKSGSFIALDLLIIVLGASFLKKKYRPYLIWDTWINAILIGITITTLLAIIGYGITVTDFYNAFFPVLRNVMPVLFGVVLGYTITPLLVNDQFTRMRATVLMMILMIIPSIINGNNFGWRHGNNSIFFCLIISF